MLINFKLGTNLVIKAENDWRPQIAISLDVHISILVLYAYRNVF